MENQSVNRPKDLSQDEVKQRLKYADAAITPELNSMANFMLHDVVDRMGKLDSKAGLLAAYCGAVITALLAILTFWTSTRPTIAFSLVAASASLAFVAGGCAVISLALQKTEWFSQDDWFREECLNSAERLKRYYILTAWKIVNSHHSAYRRKTNFIYAAQILLVFAWILLFFALLDIACPSTSRAAFEYLGVRVWKIKDAGLSAGGLLLLRPFVLFLGLG